MAAPTLKLVPDEHSGRKLGKYEILCRLSTGGMSEIFLAFQRGIGGFRKHIVLKQILPDIKGEEEFVRMFLDEARITAAFQHPNIAQVYDLDIQDGELFLAMEFVPGATLVEVARSTRQANEAIPIGFTLQATRDTAVALHYAHTFTDPLGRPQTVIHRDIAEKNIMVTYEGVTKLLDFGIAKALGHSSRTNVGMVKGTSGYMSPEQILGEPLDARSDVFALGVVLHECLTGMRLFHGKTAEDAMLQALKGEVLPPSAQNKLVPRELDQVTLKALQRKREDRYATALEFARAIERTAGPMIWHPEQSAEFVTRLFVERRDATRKLMSEAQSDIPESTGEFKLARLLGNELPPRPPPPAPASAKAALPFDPPVDGSGPKPLPSSFRPSAQEPKTIPIARRDKNEPPPPPVPDERDAPKASPPRKRDAPKAATPPRAREDQTSPGIRPQDLGLAPSSSDAPTLDREQLTIPSQSLAEMAVVIPPPGPKQRPKKVERPEITAKPTPPKQPLAPLSERLAQFAEDEPNPGGALTTDPGGKNTSETLALARGYGKGSSGILIGAAIVGIAAIAVTLFVLGMGEDDVVVSAAPPAEPIAQAQQLRPPGPSSVIVPEPVEASPAPGADAQPERESELIIEPLDPSIVVPAGVANPTPAEPAKEEKSAKKKPAAAKKPARDDSAAPADEGGTQRAVGTGTLTLVTEPFSTVYLSGKEIGSTPLVKHPIASGKHTLRLVDGDGKKFSLPVEIAADKETKVRVPLSVLKPL